MKPYKERLKDPRWQKLRLEVMQAANFTCATCGAKDKTLCVHHVNYRKGAEVWEYDLSELKCLCEVCHQQVEDELIPLARKLVLMSDPAPVYIVLRVLEMVARKSPSTSKSARNWLRVGCDFSVLGASVSISKVEDFWAEFERVAGDYASLLKK